jgi:SAM-dependent methyltransferase
MGERAGEGKQERVSNWTSFYDAVSGRPPHDTVLSALDAFGEPGFAVDLGCGDGRDTVELLRRGWRVLAIDAQREAIERLLGRVGDQPALEVLVAPFDLAEWPEADLVNAGFSLPFCPPEHFDTVWRRIVASIRPGGRFSGQLFGERDEWVGQRVISYHSRTRALDLLAPFELERFDEVETDGTTALGDPKHWHVFHVVARRLADEQAATTRRRRPSRRRG